MMLLMSFGGVNSIMITICFCQLEQYRNKDSASRNLHLSGTAAMWVRDGARLQVLAQGFI